MASNQDDGLPKPGDKTLHVWSKPVEQGGENGTTTGTTTPNARPTITEAVGMIKKDDFTNVANTPCARQGFLTGIASGAGVGGLKFVINGEILQRIPPFQQKEKIQK